MQLDYLDFKYDIGLHRFTTFSYVLRFKKWKREEVKTELEKGFKTLENMLDKEFSPARKNPHGTIKGREASVGFTYSIENDIHAFATIECEVEHKEKKIKDVKLRLYIVEQNEERLFRIYERILHLPELTIASDVQEKIESIELLRKGNPDTAAHPLDYLALED